MRPHRYPLSVIIPIHRADVDIERCLRSLLDNPYLDLQIIIAANSDRNIELYKINDLIPDLPCITLLNIRRAGKANAINEALRYVKKECVLIGDADTLFVSRGLNQCVAKIYSDRSIVAITGIVDPIVKSPLAAIQKFEYRRIFRVFRPFWNLFYANLIVSGCAGIFRTRALFHVGLYNCHTVGEDFEITLRLHEYYLHNKLPYKIVYINQLVAKTDVPDTFRALTKQRGRWFVGQVEVLWKYRFILRHPFRYKRIIIPYALAVIFEVLFTLFKWTFIAFGVCISILFGSKILKIWLITDMSFVLLEIAFNLCMKKSIKAKKWKLIVIMTCILSILQFVLKDTNLLFALRNRTKKENKW